MKKNLNQNDLNSFKKLESFLKENPDYRGVFLTVIEDLKKIWRKEKKATSLIHFYQERLDKIEKRRMLKFLSLFQTLLISLDEEKKHINESEDLQNKAFLAAFPKGSFAEKLLRGRI